MRFSLKYTMIGVVIIALLGIVGFSWNYYNSTYVGQDYYFKVPAHSDKYQTKSMSGKLVDGAETYDYDITFVNKDGKVIKDKYEQEGDKGRLTPFTKGKFMVVNRNENRTLNAPKYVEKSDVPAKALEVIDK